MVTQHPVTFQPLKHFVMLLTGNRSAARLGSVHHLHTHTL